MVITNNKLKIKKTNHNLSYNGLMRIIHATGWVSYLVPSVQSGGRMLDLFNRNVFQLKRPQLYLTLI